jgi:hypothetical protein
MKFVKVRIKNSASGRPCYDVLLNLNQVVMITKQPADGGALEYYTVYTADKEFIYIEDIPTELMDLLPK